MLLESLVKATVELQGFRVVRVTSPGWRPSWPPTGGTRRAVGSANSGAVTGTPGGSGTFAMSRCGESRSPWFTRRAASYVRSVGGCMSKRCRGRWASRGSPARCW